MTAPRLTVRIGRGEISVETPRRGKDIATIRSQSLSKRTIERFGAWAKEREPRLRDLIDFELFGRHLYDFLFQGDIGRALDDAVSRADALNKTLRVELLFEADAGELAGVPWEFLYYHNGADGKRGHFMSAHSGFSLIRTDSSAGDTSPIRLGEAARILVVASCPEGLDYVVWRPVAEDITSRLKDRFCTPQDKQLHPDANRDKPAAEVRVVLDLKDLAALKAQLAWKPHVLQFIGHGLQDGTEGQLALLNRTPPWIKGSDLLDQLAAVPREDRPRLVVLHACEGGAAARASLSPRFGFGSIAAMLLAEAIPAVVAMQYEIDQDSAITFTSQLYSDLFAGDSVDTAVQTARATLQQSTLERPARAFGAPVLHMSGTDGVLFTRPAGATDTRNEIARGSR